MNDEIKVLTAEYVLSAPSLSICPAPDRPEIAIAGRSNVGKSSLINLMCNRRQLAKTSGTPGKTRAINFFDIKLSPGPVSFYLVDLPGYGYAKVSKSMKNEWDQSLSNYLKKRTSLQGLIHLIDCRHKPSAQDIQMHGWITNNRIPVCTVLTKTDKLKSAPLRKQAGIIRDALGVSEDYPLIETSAAKRSGVQELWASVLNVIGEAPTIRAPGAHEDDSFA